MNWIQSFLSGRTQQVILNGRSSQKADVLSGVPQGTVLGPLLFLVYINDMPAFVKSKLRLFADDAYLYKVIKAIVDSQLLQTDLDSLQVWEERWDMEFHPKKCKVLTITNKKKPLKTFYLIHNEKLESVENAKYLGVTLNKNMNWKAHVMQTVKKANQQLNFLNRNLRRCSRQLKSKAFQVYVKPILAYASSVWNPIGSSNQGLRMKIESVQRKAARFVNSDWSWESSPTQMLKDLKWNSLEFDRQISSLMLLYKIINGLVEIPLTFLPKKARDEIKFQPVYGRVNAYTNSFIPSTIRWWNEIPKEFLIAGNLIEFKNKISNFLSSVT